MRNIVASSFSNAFLGGLAVWAFAISGNFLVWAAIVAWGCFFHTGGNGKAVRITLAGNFLGIFCAWVAGLLIIANPTSLAGPVWAGLVVGVVTMAMVMTGHYMASAFRFTTLVIPASFYGAASTFAFMVQTPARMTYSTLLSASDANALIVLPVSMALGVMLGYATAKMTSALGTAG